MPNPQKPELKISVISDYICPFCFIGHKRLAALRDHYDLKINWCFVEIHPETPAEGHDVTLLNYDEDQWNLMMKNLHQLAREENLTLSPQTIITNSRKALLLAEASKALGADYFYPLHERIFDACFLEGLNIGKEEVLRQLAADCHIPDAIIETAWSDPFTRGHEDNTPAALLPYLQYAGAIQARSVPTFIFDKNILTGVVSTDNLLKAAKNMSG
ncbi:MAG: DsbA family protein [Gammaproteobacteria bacterium]|nr:DsbA family protein [Gammaproteobacteria bacterium]MDH5735076.1 DsbA family protein [Gammaproteobacteria bacterium]